MGFGSEVFLRNLFLNMQCHQLMQQTIGSKSLEPAANTWYQVLDPTGTFSNTEQTVKRQYQVVLSLHFQFLFPPTSVLCAWRCVGWQWSTAKRSPAEREPDHKGKFIVRGGSMVRMPRQAVGTQLPSAEHHFVAGIQHLGGFVAPWK